jgi:PAS domain-containing protein
MKEHEAVKITIRNYRKDGSFFHNLLEITPILDKKGNIIFYLGVQYDVYY